MSNEIEIELNEDLEVEEPKKYNVFIKWWLFYYGFCNRCFSKSI